MKPQWKMGLVEEWKGDQIVGPTGIYVILPEYDPAINQALKTELPGPPRWNRDQGRWQFPLHWDVCVAARKIADRNGHDIKIAQSLFDWATAEKSRQDTIPDVQSMELVELQRIKDEAPKIWEAMSSRPFQTVGAAFAARNRACLIADDPGLGKTLQTIGAVVESGVKGPILVVAPKAAAQLTWPEQLAMWLPGDEVVVIGDNLKPAERAKAVASAQLNALASETGRRWVITSPYYLRIRAKTDQYGNYEYGPDKKKVINPVGSALMGLFEVSWAAVIVDESHQTLAGATGNKKKQSAQRLGLGALEIRDGGLRLALSGTPYRGKESYMWGQLNWLRPDMFRSYRRWVDKHFKTWFDGFGWQIGRMIDPAAMYAEAATVMIRRTKAEVAADLPAKAYAGLPLDVDRPVGDGNPVAVWLDMAPKQAKAYEAMVKQAEVELDGGILMTTGILAELTRLKQFAGSYGMMDGETFRPTLPSNKFDWLVEFLDERGLDKDMLKLDVNKGGDPDGSMRRNRLELPKIVVVSQFSQLIDTFAEGLAAQGIPTFKFTGDQGACKKWNNGMDREAVKADWQENPESSRRVLLLTTTAGGVSLTLDAADDMVILDETWNPDDQLQVEDRIHRLSRIHQVTIWKLFSRNTIEEGIARKNITSEESIKGIMDGQRGVAFVKELLSA